MITSRRDFLLTAAVPLFFSARSSFSGGGSRSSPIQINAARLRERIEAMSVFGRPAGGTFADGVTRVAYSQADIDARKYVMEQMRAVGLAVRIDPAGNIYGRRSGRQDTMLPPILFGSHVDSVPNGGNFDGPLGTLAALEVVQSLSEADVTTEHPLEMTVWQNEEGVAFGNGLCGSRAVAGEFPAPELDDVWNGTRMADAIRAIGGDPTKLSDARRMSPHALHCYVELHIEQGGTLDRAGIQIGVVQGIVAIDRYEATIKGTANHAGTTAMADRHDALIAASQLVLAMNEIVRSEPGRQVGTVGQLNVTPNAPNVVPGLVKLTIELRDLSAEKIVRLWKAIELRAAAIAKTTGTEITCQPTSHHDPLMANPHVQDLIRTSASRLGLKSMDLPSGAGHDAQMIGRLCPMGMIFVPSVGGVSHSPKESTRWDDCAHGANVLLQTVMEADKATFD